MTVKHTNVLQIDDDETSYLITRSLLSAEDATYNLEWASTFEAGLAAIRRQEHDAYLVDYLLGGERDGIELLRIAIAEGCRAPLIMVTGQDEHAVDVQAMQEGAAGFLAKGQANGVDIERAIRYAIERYRAEDQREQNEAELRVLTEQLPVIVWTTDRQLRFTSIWGAGLLKMGLQPNELVGQTLFQYFETEDENSKVIQFHRLAQRGESVAYQADWKGRSYRVQINPLHHNGHAIVGTVGIAIDVTDSKRLEDEFDAARRIQEGLLPKQLACVPGFDIAGACCPMEFTGGDYYDCVSIPGGSLGIVIADVCGHGFASALITMETRRQLRTLLHWSSDLGEILSEVNHALTEHPDRSRKFVTLFLATLDPRTHSLTYAAAGHEAYLFAADGTVQTLENKALPLGIKDDEEYSFDGPIELAAGETMLLFTDGMAEAHDPAMNIFGKQRVLESVQAHRNRPAAEIVAAVMQEVQEFCRPGVPQDDLTMVVLKVNVER